MFIIGAVKITLHASWVHSLKEKRMIVKSVIAKTRNKFNVSINEIEDMDVHQTIVIGISCTSNSRAQVDSIITQVVNYIEDNFETEVRDVEVEIL